MSASLSIVVIGRNEGSRLEHCLLSIRAMEKPEGDVEVIYVDSASTDGSCALAAKLGAQVISVQPKRPTAALGRNAGWRASSGTFILFLDGDTILHPQFVVTALDDFEKDTAVVWGNRREIHPEASLYNRVLDLDWISRPGLVDYCGGDALMRREALETAGGYDEDLIAGEEPEMCRRLRAKGWKILHVDRPMTGHDLAMTQWSQYWRRATRTGYAYAEVSERLRIRSAVLGTRSAAQSQPGKHPRHFDDHCPVTCNLAAKCPSHCVSRWNIGSPSAAYSGKGSHGNALIFLRASSTESIHICSRFPFTLDSSSIGAIAARAGSVD